MFRHVLRTYQMLSRWASRPASRRRFSSLDVTRLEERANPDATSVLTMPLAPQSVVIAPAIPAASSMAIAMPGQSMVRVDLIALSEGSKTDYAETQDDSEVVKPQVEDVDGPQSNVDANSDDELAAMIEAAAQECVSQ